MQAAGGYDTHSDQATTLAANLTTISDTLFAFQRDLEGRGIADRVLLHVWSEFGRRGQENGSGTDHGAGGISFVIGNKAKGTMVETFPASPGRRSTAAATCAPPPTSAASTARCSRSGSTSTRGRSSRAPDRFRGMR